MDFNSSGKMKDLRIFSTKQDTKKQREREQNGSEFKTKQYNC